MAFAVAVSWRAVPGHEADLAELIGLVATASRAERGNLFFEAHIATDDPRSFFLYELFVDEAAYEIHRTSEHVRTFIAERAAPYIESRSVSAYRTIGA